MEHCYLLSCPPVKGALTGTGAGARGSSQSGQHQKNQKAKTNPALLGALKVKLEGLFGHLTQGLGEGPERGEGVKGVRGQGSPWNAVGEQSQSRNHENRSRPGAER